MARPSLQWKGSVEVESGDAMLSAGEMCATVPMNSCSDAMKVQKLLDKAYIDGARDALMHMERIVSISMSDCRAKW